MGLGDPFHKHPLRSRFPGEFTPKCFHCKLTTRTLWYSCSRCDYWAHKSCLMLPPIVTHPLHDQHPLLLLSDTKDKSNANFCNKCRTPCTGEGYIYSCRACKFSLHSECFISHHHEKHDHPLSFQRFGHQVWPGGHYLDCKICGYPVYDSNFVCKKCEFCIHHDCSIIPSTVNHHHVHEISIRHDFPEESDQFYCDVCEDRDDKELDRTLSYYYCQKCDYIAHVACVTQQEKDALLIKRTAHEHPLRILRDPMIRKNVDNFKLGCNLCNIVFDSTMLEFPSLIKHPLHPEHTLSWVCDDRLFKCTDCEFTLRCGHAIGFNHPLYRKAVVFRTDDVLFRCDACGDLAKGFRMYSGLHDLDFHLECFALPGNIDHESHSHHPLYLFPHDPYRVQNCNVCKAEIDPEQWVYCCPECDIISHVKCVAAGLLSALQLSIKNEPSFCAIIGPNEASFSFQIANNIFHFPQDLSPASPRHSSSTGWTLFVKETDDLEICDLYNCYADLGIKEAGDALCCPKCKLLICTPTKYPSILDWETQHSSNGLILSESDPLMLLTNEQIDNLYCSICSVLIFPPSYSCCSCQIYFHKSCAELPRKVSMKNLTHVLVEPPFHDSFSSCSSCKYPITGYAYLSSDGAYIYDVQCIVGAPLINRVVSNPRIVCQRQLTEGMTCIACRTCINKGTHVFRTKYTLNDLTIHIECAWLPPVIQHRIHQHPLELALDLAMLDDEYICDVCEKELNPNLWAYRCMDTCKGYATSHVTCVITSKRKCHLRYDLECQDMSEDQKQLFRYYTMAGAHKYSTDVL